MKNKKYHTIRKIPKYNRKIAKTEANSISLFLGKQEHTSIEEIS